MFLRKSQLLKYYINCYFYNKYLYLNLNKNEFIKWIY